jgi:hypothetical protein
MHSRTYLKYTKSGPHSLLLLKPFPTNHSLSSQAPSALFLSKGLHSDTSSTPQHHLPQASLFYYSPRAQVQVYKAKYRSNYGCVATKSSGHKVYLCQCGGRHVQHALVGWALLGASAVFTSEQRYMMSRP